MIKTKLIDFKDIENEEIIIAMTMIKIIITVIMKIVIIMMIVRIKIGKSMKIKKKYKQFISA